jgi:hypothetical protein
MNAAVIEHPGAGASLLGSEGLLSPRVIGAIVGGTVSTLVGVVNATVWPRAGEGDGLTGLDGIPAQVSLLAIGAIVGSLLGFVTAPAVISTKRPVPWMVGLG